MKLLGVLLLYLLIGQFYSLTYALIYKPDSHSAMLGLMGLFWPVCLVIDLLMQIAAGFGRFTHMLMAKFEKRDVSTPGT